MLESFNHGFIVSLGILFKFFLFIYGYIFIRLYPYFLVLAVAPIMEMLLRAIFVRSFYLFDGLCLFKYFHVVLFILVLIWSLLWYLMAI